MQDWLVAGERPIRWAVREEGIMRLLFGSLLVLASGCCSARCADLSSLTDHERIWDDSGVRNYRFDISWFAHHSLAQYRGPIRVTVINSRVKSATYVERTYIGESEADIASLYAAPGEPVPPRVQKKIVKTIPELFEFAEARMCGGADVVRMKFDPDHGYPRRLSVDPKKRAFDDNFAYFVRNFEVLP